MNISDADFIRDDESDANLVNALKTILRGDQLMNTATIEEKKKHIKETLRCPHCDAELKKWEVPQTIFTEWPNEYFYICFNDECSYFVRGWDAMAAQGNNCSYRLMYDPLTDSCQPAPVQTRAALRDGIVD